MAAAPDPPSRRPRGFTCPRCGGPTRVRKTRAAAPNVVRRRRACPLCPYRVTTLERPAGGPVA